MSEFLFIKACPDIVGEKEELKKELEIYYLREKGISIKLIRVFYIVIAKKIQQQLHRRKPGKKIFKKLQLHSLGEGVAMAHQQK